MNRSAVAAAVTAAVTVLFAGLVPACQKADATVAKQRPVALPPVAVEVAPVEVRKMPRYLTLTGTVAADRQSEVAANVSGRISSVPIERGQKVREGQTLAVVDSKAAGFSVAASAAQAQLADTQVSQAQEDCERAERIFNQGAMSKAEFDRQRSQCKSQLYQAHAARAQADLAAKLAGDTIIRAPFNGTVGERYINVGEYVQPPTRVASIFALDPVRVSISVPEPVVGQVHEGQTLDVRVAAWPDRSFPAVVKFVSPALRTTTRDLLVEARAVNSDAALRPGMFATVLLATGEEQQPTVPLDAIVNDGTVKRLFLARDGQAFELVVRIGVSKDGRVAVLEPLDGKTQVIRHPPPGLRDGSAITFAGSVAGGAAGEH